MPVKTLVKIHKKSITPQNTHVLKKEKVDFGADEPCKVAFDDGSSLTLDGHTMKSLSFNSAGDHRFTATFPNSTACPTGNIIVT